MMIVFSSELSATHIVGGVIYYEYIGGTSYKLTFKIYRDCNGTGRFDGDTGTNLTFFFGIFEGNVDVLLLDSSSRSSTPKSIKAVGSSVFNSCLNPNGSCVEEGIYEKIITLPSNSVGYTIIHQRCCRNASILNIDPLPGSSTMPGITLRCFIPPISTFRNNSAVFRKFPPLFICKDQAFYFDHSAIDIDGDSLKYFLINPLAGLTESIPLSQNQSLSDNIPIPYISPYSSSNILGGTPALTIDSLTGFLQCKPNTFGRFVVSVLVTETRGGIVIDSIVRDFQFNVVTCDIPKADMPFIDRTYNPNTNIGDYLHTFCDTFFAKFINTSSNANAYKWDFGDPSTGINNTSFLFEPSHVYSDTGVYVVKLIAFKIRPTDTCSDTTKRIVRVYPNFKVNFIGNNVCQGDSIQFTDMTTSRYGVTNKWKWDFGDGTMDTVKNPKHRFNVSGNMNIKLFAIDSKLCRDDTIKSVIIFPKPILNPIKNKLCLNESVELKSEITNLPLDSIAEIRWISSSFDSMKSSIFITASNLNSINIKLKVKTNHGCIDSSSQLIKVNPLPKPPVLADSYFIKCKDSISLSITDTAAIGYLWDDGIRDSMRPFFQPRLYRFQLTYPCKPNQLDDSVVIYQNKLTSNFIVKNNCFDSLSIFKNMSSSSIVSEYKWAWRFGDGSLDSVFRSSSFYGTSHLYSSSDTFRVSLHMYDTFGCVDSSVQKIIIYPKPTLNPSIPPFCIGVPLDIKCGVTIPSPYQISYFRWDTNSIKTNLSCDFTHTVYSTIPKLFNLIATSDKGCKDSNSYNLKIYPIPNPVKLDDSFIYNCADSLYIDIKDSWALSYIWSDGSTDSIRYLNYPDMKTWYIQYPCFLHTDSFVFIKNCSIKVPTAFSPNGDGNNDVLFIRGFGVKKLIGFKIFNRLGQVIFHTTDFNFGWDGYYKGVLQNTDSYYYNYSAESYNDPKIISGEGNFMLLK
jgi:gliding motility-associated-like protein